MKNNSSRENEREKAIKLKLFLEDYGEEKGYDRTGFYQQILRKFRTLEGEGAALKEALGVQRSGGLWVGFRSKLKSWLDATIKPGPNYEVRSIPDFITAQELLEFRGIYHLKEVLKKLDPEIVTYWKVVGAIKRSQDPANEVGAFLKNGVYVVDMVPFSKWYSENEP